MNVINKLFFFFMLMGFCNISYAQKEPQDIWSGNYALNSINNHKVITIDTLLIAKTTDANPKEIAARYESDLARWTLTSKREGGKEQQIVRRFLFDEEDKDDAYKEFGWTDLYKSGKMNCIDGGHFFICQTEPNTKVKFGIDEKFVTKTGVFGIWLHYGLVELQKVK